MSGPARVLVVDDERALRRLLRLYLSKEGFAVAEAENGADALSLLRRGGVDLALIDVMLPEVDGFEVVRRIRQESTIPIILLTARGEETNRVAGLELGADDYVVKPFSAPEVIARVRAQLRRAQQFAAEESLLRRDGVELDRAERRCLVHGKPVELTRRETTGRRCLSGCVIEQPLHAVQDLASQPGRVNALCPLVNHAGIEGFG